MSVSVCVCERVHTQVGGWFLHKLVEGIRSTGTGVTGSYEQSDLSIEN